jgi:hypothetical protein
MKPLLRVVLIVNALLFLAFGLLFVLTPWAGLYEAAHLDSIRVQPSFAGQLLGIALFGLAWLAFHAAIDGALTARAARVSGHVQWLSGIVVMVWLLGLHTPQVDGFGQMMAATVGIVLLVLGLGSVRLSSAVRRRDRAVKAGAASAERAEKKAAKTRAEMPVTVDKPLNTNAITPRGMDGGAVDPVTGGTLDPVTGRTFDPVSGREIDPVTGKRIEPVLSEDIDPATGRRVASVRTAADPASGAPH